MVLHWKWEIDHYWVEGLYWGSKKVPYLFSLVSVLYWCIRMLGEKAYQEVEMNISFHPFWVKVVMSKGKKKRKVSKAESSYDDINNDDDASLSQFQSKFRFLIVILRRTMLWLEGTRRTPFPALHPYLPLSRTMQCSIESLRRRRHSQDHILMDVENHKGHVQVCSP